MRSKIARAVLIGLALVSVTLLALVLYPIASALLFAAVLAGAFQPSVHWLAARLGRRALAAGLVTAAVAEVHAAVIFFALVGGLAAFGPAGLAAGPLIVAFLPAIVRMCRRDVAEAEQEELSAALERRSA